MSGDPHRHPLGNSPLRDFSFSEIKAPSRDFNLVAVRGFLIGFPIPVILDPIAFGSFSPVDTSHGEAVMKRKSDKTKAVQESQADYGNAIAIYESPEGFGLM